MKKFIKFLIVILLAVIISVLYTAFLMKERAEIDTTLSPKERERIVEMLEERKVITKNSFNDIVVSGQSDTAIGETKGTLVQRFGKPSEVTELNENGLKKERVVWEGKEEKSNITVVFVDGRAETKSQTGLK